MPRVTHNVEHDVRHFRQARDLVEVLMRADGGLDAELRLEILCLALVADKSGDFKALPVGMVQEASKDGAADVAWQRPYEYG